MIWTHDNSPIPRRNGHRLSVGQAPTHLKLDETSHSVVTADSTAQYHALNIPKTDILGILANFGG